MKKSNKRKTQLRDELFSLQAKPKKVSALEPAQKLGSLRCFWLVFDISKTRLKKDLLKKITNKRKTSTKKRTFVLYQLDQNIFLN